MTKENHSVLFPLMSGSGMDEETLSGTILAQIEGNHVRVSDALGAYYARRKSWLHRVFPTKLDKILRDAQLNQAKTELGLLQRVLELAAETKIGCTIPVVRG